MLRKNCHVSVDRDKRKQAQPIIIIPIHRYSAFDEALRPKDSDGDKQMEATAKRRTWKDTNGQEYRPDRDTTAH